MYTLWREGTAWGAWVQPSARTAAEAAPVPGCVFLAFKWMCGVKSQGWSSILLLTCFSRERNRG